MRLHGSGTNRRWTPAPATSTTLPRPGWRAARSRVDPVAGHRRRGSTGGSTRSSSRRTSRTHTVIGRSTRHPRADASVDGPWPSPRPTPDMPEDLAWVGLPPSCGRRGVILHGRGSSWARSRSRRPRGPIDILGDRMRTQGRRRGQRGGEQPTCRDVTRVLRSHRTPTVAGPRWPPEPLTSDAVVRRVRQRGRPDG